MKDYSKHPYRWLLSYIEKRCQKLKEEKDFVSYLLSMECAESIEELITIYNTIYKLLAVLILQSYTLPEYWYITKTLGIGNAYLFDELKQFFNDNLLRLFKAVVQPTKEERVSFISNLRECSNTLNVLNQMLEVSGEDFREEYGFVIAKILSCPRCKKEIEQHYYLSESDHKITAYKDCYKVLAAHHRLFDIAETLFWKQYGLDCDGLAKQYKKECELAELKEKESTSGEQRKMESALAEENVKTKRRNVFLDALFMPIPIMDKVGGTLFSILLSLPLAFLGAILPFGKGGRR